jgi:Fe-S-cluster containining protein
MRRTGQPWESFATLHQARLLAFDPDTIMDMEGDGWSYMLGLKSHPCIFLKGDLCAIHESAPLSCKRYPFKLDGKLNMRFCPLASNLLFRLAKPDIPAQELKKELELHKGIVKEWNKKPGKKEDCIPFLLHRANGTSSG